MKYFLIALIIIPLTLRSQNSVEYVAKIRMPYKLFKSTCCSLTLNGDSTFIYKSFGKDTSISETGRYFINKDTIETIYKLNTENILIANEKNEKNIFEIRFTEYFDHAILIDTIKIFRNGKIIDRMYRIKSIKFIDADSIIYYLRGNSMKLNTIQKEFREKKKIRISLPVEYYIKKDNDTFRGMLNMFEYRRTNVP